jgi:HD superfamily phosphohydrolase YqeK
MSDLEKLIYIADKIEPNRDYPGVEELRTAVRKDFRAGFLRVIGAVIEYVVARSLPLDYNSVAAWNRALSDIGVRPSGHY